MNKKGNLLIGWAVILIIVILIIIVLEVNKECRRDNDCPKDMYCAVGNICKDIPVIEKTVYKQDLLKPAALIALAVIIGAWFIKRKKQPKIPSESYYDQIKPEEPLF